MRKVRLLSLFAGIVPLAVLGADFDGSKPLICAQASAQQCVAHEGCKSVSPDESGIPTFLKINFRKKEITNPDTGDGTEIATFTKIDIASL